MHNGQQTIDKQLLRQSASLLPQFRWAGLRRLADSQGIRLIRLQGFAADKQLLSLPFWYSVCPWFVVLWSVACKLL